MNSCKILSRSYLGLDKTMHFVIIYEYSTWKTKIVHNSLALPFAWQISVTIWLYVGREMIRLKLQRLPCSPGPGERGGVHGEGAASSFQSISVKNVMIFAYISQKDFTALELLLASYSLLITPVCTEAPCWDMQEKIVLKVLRLTFRHTGGAKTPWRAGDLQ